MKVKKVQMYQSTDGKLHETEEQCRNHEQKANLRLWYEDGNELSGRYEGSLVQYDHLVQWLVLNQTEAYEIIKQYGI